MQDPQSQSTYPEVNSVTTRPNQGRSALPTSSVPKTSVLLVLSVLLLIGGFVSGIQYQKGKGTSITNTNAKGAISQMSGFGNMGQRNGGFGSVTSISNSSITITESAMGGPNNSSSGTTGTSKTYIISSDTAITDNGSTVTASVIQIGDVVFVRTSSSTSIAATVIDVNPTMGGGPGRQTQTTNNGTTTSTMT